MRTSRGPKNTFAVFCCKIQCKANLEFLTCSGIWHLPSSLMETYTKESIFVHATEIIFVHPHHLLLFESI